MDFQKILELASKNQKVAEKKLTETKRYSTAVPPPKKEPRPLVDPDAIRARIDQKEKEKQQKLIDEERKKKEGAKRQLEAERKAAEEKRNNRRAARKAKPSPDPKGKSKTHASSEGSSRREKTPGYQDKEHEAVHGDFMHKVEKHAERHREKVARKEAEARTSKPKPMKKKKAPPALKKPMTYEEILKFAEQQKAGSTAKRDGGNEEEEEDSEEEESEEEVYESRPRERRDDRHFDRNREQSRDRKIKERLKEERLNRVRDGNNRKNFQEKHDRAPSHNFHKDRNRPSVGLAKDSKGHRHSSEAERSVMKKQNGAIKTDGMRKEGRVDNSRKLAGDRISGGDDRRKVASSVPSRMGDKQVNRTGDRAVGGIDRKKVNNSVPSRVGEKQVNRSGERPVSKTLEKTSSAKQPSRPTGTQSGRTSDHLPRRPAEKLPVRPGERPPSKPPGKPDSRPVPSKPSRPIEHHDGRARDRPRPVNHERERPRPSGMGPPRRPEMMRKRPAKPPIMHVKRGRMVSDTEESDYDDEDGFIDDTPLDEDGAGDVSSYIKEIFGYDKSKYGYESDYALRAMDTSYRDIQKEEARSSRLGMLEDLEDIRREKEEMKRKAMKHAKKRDDGTLGSDNESGGAIIVSLADQRCPFVTAIRSAT